MSYTMLIAKLPLRVYVLVVINVLLNMVNI
jgi:hypothetical protein